MADKRHLCEHCTENHWKCHENCQSKKRSSVYIRRSGYIAQDKRIELITWVFYYKIRWPPFSYLFELSVKCILYHGFTWPLTSLSNTLVSAKVQERTLCYFGLLETTLSREPGSPMSLDRLKNQIPFNSLDIILF